MKTAKLPTRIDRFWGDYRFLSNFYIQSVRLWIAPDGTPFGREIPGYVAVEDYDSVEHAYQAGKSLKTAEREKFRIRGVTPSRAKLMGGSLRNIRKDWELPESNGRMAKVNLMRDLLVQKFLPTVLRRRLMSTFSATLIEGNNWHDQFWGVCDGTCDKGPHEPGGLNFLGRLLTEVRSFYGMGTPLE